MSRWNPWQWTPRTTRALAHLLVEIAEPPVMTPKAMLDYSLSDWLNTAFVL